MPDMKAQTISLHEGNKIALQYLGAAVVLLVYLWFNPMFLPINSLFVRGPKKRRRPQGVAASSWSASPFRGPGVALIRKSTLVRPCREGGCFST